MKSKTLIFKVHLIFLYLWIKSINCFGKTDWNLHGKSGDGYYIAMHIGSPPQRFNLLVDTGSSNLAIAGSPHSGVESFFNHSISESYVDNGTAVKVIYAQGWWNGFLGRDVVSLPSLSYLGSVETDLSIMTHAEGFSLNTSHWQGILGLAYSEIAQPNGSTTTWFDSLNKQIPNETNDKFSLELCGPSTSRKGFHTGRFTVGNGGHNCQKSEYSAKIHHKWFYEVLILRMDVGEDKLDVPCSHFNAPKTIIDSGTTNLQFPHKTFELIVHIIKSKTEENGGSKEMEEFWRGAKDICFPDRTLIWFPNITIYLDHSVNKPFGIVIPPQSYLRPSPNASDSNYCYVLGIEKSHSGTVLGAVLLEGLCVTFDRKTSKIFFAHSTCGPNTLLIAHDKSEGLTCQYVPHVVNGPLIATIVILILILLPLFVAFLRFVWLGIRKQKTPANSVPFVTLGDTDT